MRPIKFRAWDGKKMVADEKLVFWNGNCYLNESGTLNDPAKPHSPARLKGYTVTAVLQSTGLLDKSGREIYEGDIVRSSNYPEATDCPVVWHEGEYWLKDSNFGFEDTLVSTYDDLEVIGSIYENPELLGGEDA